MMIRGEEMPGGNWRMMFWERAVNWLMAMRMSAPGWKNTLTTERPATVCDSMCSMLSTTVVM